MEPTSVEQPIRAAEIVGFLSLATDLGTGQPLRPRARLDRAESAPGR